MWNSSAQLYMCFNLYFYMAVVEWSNDSLQFELRGLEEVWTSEHAEGVFSWSGKPDLLQQSWTHNLTDIVK